MLCEKDINITYCCLQSKNAVYSTTLDFNCLSKELLSLFSRYILNNTMLLLYGGF